MSVEAIELTELSLSRAMTAPPLSSSVGGSEVHRCNVRAFFAFLHLLLIAGNPNDTLRKEAMYPRTSTEINRLHPMSFHRNKTVYTQQFTEKTNRLHPMSFHRNKTVHSPQFFHRKNLSIPNEFSQKKPRIPNIIFNNIEAKCLRAETQLHNLVIYLHCIDIRYT